MARLEDQKKFKNSLLRLRADDEISKAEFDEANAECRAEIAVTEQELIAFNSRKGMQDAFVRFAELQWMDIAGAWKIVGPEQRRRVQSLLFEGGLRYSPEQEILNRSKVFIV